jgi:hypothetical protein
MDWMTLVSVEEGILVEGLGIAKGLSERLAVTAKRILGTKCNAAIYGSEEEH